MIHSVTITNQAGESIDLILTRPDLSGLAIQSIDGLGPPAATVNSSEWATTDGALVSTVRVSTRQIVFNLVMWEGPNRSIEDCRLLTYKYFPIKKQIRMRFVTDKHDCWIDGYVESNEPDIFSEQETASISVLCPIPWFQNSGGSASSFSGVQPMFEFPFSNESLTEDLIEFGNMSLDTGVYLYYTGDVDNGMVVTLNFTGPSEQITIFDRTTSETLKIDTNKVQKITGGSISGGDVITISTVVGEKYARINRGGKVYNIISAITKDSTWFIMRPGANEFAFTANVGDNNILATFSCNLTYGGI